MAADLRRYNDSMALNLRQIEVFRAVMITGSVSGAAQLLFVSQPAVSRLLSQTENRLGFALFERIKGRLHATAEAKEVFRHWHNQAVRLRNGEEREGEAKLMRSRENAIRIATVLAAADWLTKGDTDNSPPLTAEHAARGVALADFFLSQTLALTKGAAFERRQARLEELLKFVDQAGGQITLRLLRKSHGFGEIELRQIVARNSAKLRIETLPTTEKGGRPSPCLIAIGNAKAAGEARPKLPKLPKPMLRRRLRRVSGVSGVLAETANGNSAT